MFFFQRKATSKEVRTLKFRDEWGQLHEIEVTVIDLEPSDEIISELLETTITIRRLE